MFQRHNRTLSAFIGCLRRRCPYLMTASLAAFVLLVPAFLAGQVAASGPQVDTAASGTISGHVRGPGDVPVPGATVELIEVETGEHKATWTDEAGNYTLSGVKPGNYKLDVSLVGFQTDVRQPVPVSAGNPLQVNVAMVLSQPKEAPSAAGGRGAGARGVANLDSLPPETQQRIRTALAQGGGGALPGGALAGASMFGQAAGQGPGQGEVRFSNSGAGAQGESSSQDLEASSVDAGSSAANSFLLSGGVGQAPTPEGNQEGRMRERIQEFHTIQVGAPGFGGGGGGFGDFFFFSGGGRQRPRVNRIRGNISEEYSNSAFDARPYPLNVAQSPQLPSYSEQARFGVGGPLVIPRIYNGKDKTSFFVNYSLGRNRNPFDSFSTVPTPAERGGNFADSVIQSGPLKGTVPVIYDPATAAPFVGNQIPAPMLNSAALGLLKFIPTPNLPGSVQNFHLQQALPSNNDRFMARIGHQISDKDSLSLFYFLNSARSQSVSGFPQLTSNTSVRGQNINFGETHTFNPHLTNTFGFNFNRQRASVLNPFAFQQNLEAGLGIQGVSQNPFDWGLPITSFTNFSGLNDTIPSLVRNQTVRTFDSVIWNRGKHNIRVGGELRRVQLNNDTDPDARGTFTFTGFTTSNFTAAGSPIPGTGFDFADFLLGLPQTTSVRFGTSSNYLRSWVYSGFAQDDWRATPRLTFNVGLRYEDFQPFTEKYGHVADLAIGPGFSTVGVVTGQSPDGLPGSLLRNDARNLAPRLGLAFRPWTSHQFVMRAGYGVFYDGSIYQRLTPNLVDQPPFAQASTLVTTPAQVLTLQNGFPVIAASVTHNTYAIDPSFRTPYGQSWNFTLEDQLVRNVILSVGYVGTKGSSLDLLLAPNTAFVSSSSAAGHALPFTYETSGAASIYHGLQVELSRQFHSGLSISGNYTYSKSIDDASSVGGAGRIVAQNFLDLEAERGLSTFDMRHNFRLNYEYEFPFGARHRYLNRGGALARLLGDWQISGHGTVQSGTPFTARILGNQSNNTGSGPFFAERADATGLAVTIPVSEQSTARYFNIAAFTLPAPGVFGSAGRNTIPGPSNIGFNMSLDRHIDISREKGMRLDFRVEANNVFNTPSFSGLATVVNANDFGRVTSVRGMRTADVSLRFRF